MATTRITDIINASVNRGDKGDKGNKGDKGAQLSSATVTNNVVTFVNTDGSSFELSGIKGDTGSKGEPGAYAGKGDKGDQGPLGYGGPRISNIEVANSSYGVVAGQQTVDVTGGYVVITGSGFLTGCNVTVGNYPALSVTFVSDTVVRARINGQVAGSYHVYLVNTDGGTAIRLNGITFGLGPGWITDSTLPTFLYTQAIYVYLNATSDSSITYALADGSSLPTGLTLSSAGLLSGTVSNISSNTTYNFSVVATDAENQTSSRAFSLTVALGEFKQTLNLVDKLYSTTVAGILDNTGVYGYSVSASANGYRIAVGNPYESKNNATSGTNFGSVQVLQKSSTTANTWISLQKITGVTTNTAFGTGTAMSGDGSKLVVGAPSGNYTYVYEFANNEFKLANTMNGSQSPFSIVSTGKFGERVDISDDGRYVVVSAPMSNTTLGRTFVVDVANAASPNVVLTINGTASEYTGAGVSIAGNSTAGYVVAIIGGSGSPRTLRIATGNTDPSSWIEISPTTAANGANSVSVATDLSYIAVGTLDESVRIYSNSGSTLLHTLTAFDSAVGDRFGRYVYTTKFGSTNYLLVGADGKDDATAGVNVGSVYVYSSTNTTNWQYRTQIMPAEASNAGLGLWHAGMMCSNSSHPIIITGAPRQLAGGQQNGVIYVTSSDNNLTTFTTSRFNNIPNVNSPMTSMGMSADGSTIVIGMPADSTLTANSNHGSVALFEKTGNTFTNTQRFYAEPVSNSNTGGTLAAAHGGTIAISGNGSVIVVGHPNRDTNTSVTKTGGAIIHQKNSSTGVWKNSSIWYANAATNIVANCQMGWSVAISNVGHVIVAGAPYATTFGNTGGIMRYTYSTTLSYGGGQPATSSGDFWANTYPGDGFGYSVCVSNSYAYSTNTNVQLIATGAPFATSRTGSGNTQEGYVTISRLYVAANTHSYITQVRSSDIAAGDQFGYSVALSPDGYHLAVGAPGRDDGQSGAGAVYVFTNNGSDEFTTQTPVVKLQASPTSLNERFGTFVTMSNSNTIYVGAASSDSHGRTDSGAAYKFTKSGGTWAQTAKFISNNAAFAHDNAGFGAIVAATSDDSQVAILAPNDKASSNGSVYVFNQAL